MFAKNEKVLPIAVEDEMKKSYIDYSMSVIVGRALPDARDGLKPVHRRILYGMKDLGLVHNRPYKKSARVVGEVLGKYHPHGDTAVYDAMVRMVQDFSMRYPLIDGQGNFGSIDGDNAAAMRYTEARMDSLAEELLEDIDKDTVDWRLNFDESLEEPEILPAKVPNMLINGASGIAVGMATNIPPHNLIEVVDGVKALIDNPDITVPELMKYVKGPDFPTGGIIYGMDEIKRMYETGRGIMKVKGKASVEQLKGGKESIVVTEIPYYVNKSNLIERVAALVNDKKIAGISDVRDESDKDGLRVVFDLKRGEIPQVILNQLFKHTQLSETFGAIMLALDKNQPRVMTLKEMMGCFVNHRVEVVTRRTQFELKKAELRAHILEGFKIALANIDKVVKIIRESKDREVAREKLIKAFKLTEIQANAILDLRLYQLTNLEQTKIEEEYLELIKKIEYLKGLLADSRKILGVIKKELDGVKDKYGDERRTQIVADKETDFKIEDLIADEACLITITYTGYIKRTAVSLYRSQRRGGRGVTGMETKEEDFVEHLFACSTHDYILFFTEDGKVHWIRVYDIPEGGRATKGKAIVNLLEMPSGTKIASMVKVRDFTESANLIMATEKGTIKKTRLEEFSNPRRGGIIAINIGKGDKLISVKKTTGHSEIVLATKKGFSIRFPEEQAREQGRATQGVRGIRLRQDDVVVAMEIVNDLADLFVVCENGYGKRTGFEEYRKQSRGGKGIITVKTTERNGDVIGVVSVLDEDEIMLITEKGQMVRLPIKDFRAMGRNTQGVRVIRLAEKDYVQGLCRVEEKEDETLEAEIAEAEVAQEQVPAEEPKEEEQKAEKPAPKKANPAKAKAPKTKPKKKK